MYIHEAIKEAIHKGTTIRRRDEVWIQFNLSLILPISEPLLLVESGSRLAHRYNPNAIDLMADDWEVWPE